MKKNKPKQPSIPNFPARNLFIVIVQLNFLLLLGDCSIFAQGNAGPSAPNNCNCGPCINCSNSAGTQSPTYARPTEIPLPVELSGFTAAVDRNNVMLNWSTSGEINNSGFDVERSDVINQTHDKWNKIGSVKGNGTTNGNTDYTFSDNNLRTGKYKYRLIQIDFNGSLKYYNLQGEVEVGVPKEYKLSQNFPNPFNPITRIEYDLPYDGKISIILFDILGREVAKLVNQIQSAGYLSVSFNASNLSSGAYFYKIIAEGNAGQKFTDTKKMVVLK